MSGRIRSVKPEWLEDERLALASDAARTLSIALILLADDYGNGRANTVQLTGRVFPGKPPEHLANALEELLSIDYVRLYEVDGQRYFSIRNWSKHQRVDKPGKEKVPPPPDESKTNPDTSENSGESRENSGESREKNAITRASRAFPSPSFPVPDPTPGQESDPPAPSGVQITVEPTSLESSLALPIRERCEFVLRRPDMAQWIQPERWPEVMSFASAVGSALKFTPRLGRYDRDSGVRAAVELFAAGYTAPDLDLAAKASQSSSYFQQKAKRDLCAFTPAVVRILLADAEPLKPETDTEELEARRKRAAEVEAMAKAARERQTGTGGRK